MVSCTTSESSSDESKINKPIKSLRELAKNKYGKNYTLTSNSTNEYVLSTNKPESDIPSNEIINYFVFDKKNHSIVDEDIIRNSTIKWHSEYEIIIVKIPEMVQKNKIQRNGYILNVKTQLKTKIDGGVY